MSQKSDNSSFAVAPLRRMDRTVRIFSACAAPLKKAAKLAEQ